MKEATTDFTLCALSDLYSLFSQMLSEHHLVCEAEIGGGEQQRKPFDERGKGVDAAQREKSHPPHLSGYLGTW